VDVVALRDQELGVTEEVGAVLDDPSGARMTTGLLVGRGEQDDVPRQPALAPRQREERRRLDRRQALAVERSPPVAPAVASFASEGRDLPGAGICGHNVEVREQDDRPALLAPAETGDEVAAPGARLDDLHLEARVAEVRGEHTRGGGLIAGRIVRV